MAWMRFAPAHSISERAGFGAAMFDALKNFIAEVAGAEAPGRSFGEEDYRLAAVALLIHVANVDGETDFAELLGVSTRDRVLARQRVAGQTPRDAPFEGPWSAPAAKGKA